MPESELPIADAHGQYRFNYRHDHFKNGEEENYLLEAFRRDFKVNGPSVLRMIRVLLNGWQKYKDAPQRVKDRVAWEVFPLRSSYAGAVWAMCKWYSPDNTDNTDNRIAQKAEELLRDIYAEFGWLTRIIAPVIGRYALFTLKREEERLAEGWTYEPRSFYQKNPAAGMLKKELPAKSRVEKAPSIIKQPLPVLKSENI